jgi:heme/copper-type cytochrome/quinol oxidase subunit 2
MAMGIITMATITMLTITMATITMATITMLTITEEAKVAQKRQGAESSTKGNWWLTAEGRMIVSLPPYCLWQ